MLHLRSSSGLFLGSSLLLSLFVTAGCGAVKVTTAEALDEEVGPGDDGGISVDFGTGDTPFNVDGGPPIGLEGISLEPGNAVITIDTTTSPATPGTVTYKATLNGDDGSKKDVTGTATFKLDDPGLGAFAGPTFTSVDKLPGTALGVTTIVRANAEGKSGAANLTIIQLRKTGEKRDFFFEVPYMGPPSPDRDVLKFGTNIKAVDVAVTMDTTGSMSGSVNNLKTNLSTTIFPELAKAIPSVGLSVSYHDDYPTGSYGSPSCGKALPGDLPHGTIQVVTTDLKLAQDGANKLEVHCGADGPESQVPSMFHMLTGNELTWPGGSVPKHTPPAGRFGGVDFRPGALPVVVLITDISWHDAKSSPYSFPAPSADDVQKAMLANNARFVDITSGDESQANALSDATASNVPTAAFGACPSGTGCCTGVSGAGRPATGPGGTCRLNFLHSGGTGVSVGIVKAIQAISVGSQFDVTAQPSNDPTNAVGEDGKPVDATQFIKALRAMDEGDAKQGCPPHAAKDTDGDGVKDTFTAVVVGTPVCFEVLPKMNTTVKPKGSAQFFNAFIDVLGMPGSIKLDQRVVIFLVGPRDIAAK